MYADIHNEYFCVHRVTSLTGRVRAAGGERAPRVAASTGAQ
jgi:hypothetical protein